jgi:CRISPR-associated protein Cas1
MTQSSRPQFKPAQILLSKRANVFYLEHVRIQQMDERLIILGNTDAEVEQFFNLPERNTAFLLLGKGTSITDAAARRLADSNVMLGFCGSGGSPLFSAMDITFMAPQSEYRPTEYMQSWMRLWLDENQRTTAARLLLKRRLEITLKAWDDNPALLRQKINIADSAARQFETGIRSAANTAELLSLEAVMAKKLYSSLANGFRVHEFSRHEGAGKSETTADMVNSMLDQGNYIAYGYAAVALHGLGISFALPLLHGKTRRGALVFDIADLIKDAFVMPLAFEFGSKQARQKDFRIALIDRMQQEKILDMLFGFVQEICKKTE